jgi:hypothetical protein
MPDADTHLAAAARNKACIDRLMPHIADHPEWVAAIAFYEALHVVEAGFALEKPDYHSEDHKDRLDHLKTPRYSHIYHDFRVMYVASRVARYLSFGSTFHASFSDYLPPEQVRDLLIGTHLKNIKAAVGKLTGRKVL